MPGIKRGLAGSSQSLSSSRIAFKPAVVSWSVREKTVRERSLAKPYSSAGVLRPSEALE